MKIETSDIRLISIPEGPVALADAQRNYKAKLTTGFNAVLATVEGLDKGLTPEVRAERKRNARNAFHEQFSEMMEDVRKIDRSAQVIEAAHLSTEAIRARAVLAAKAADVAATVSIIAGTNGPDLQAVGIEAYRKADFVTASLVAREVGRRVAVAALASEEAAVILEIVERTAVPQADAVAREAVKNAQLDAVDCESIFRSGSLGESLTPVDRLSIERRKESIRDGGNEKPFVITPSDGDRYGNGAAS